MHRALPPPVRCERTSKSRSGNCDPWERRR